ncbi:MAG: hypothetical protein D6753_00020 [Planctomycetota bacterium]|nr:MAG: hypothetical protein D6753_00020 [Planctomycetota bacterium]
MSLGMLGRITARCIGLLSIIAIGSLDVAAWGQSGGDRGRATVSSARISPAARRLNSGRASRTGTATTARPASHRPVRAAGYEEEIIGPSVIEMHDSASESNPPSNAMEPSEFGCATCGMEYDCVCRPDCYFLDWSRSDILVGAAGFKTQANYLTTGGNDDGQVEGSFGFQEGINFGSRIPGFFYGQLGGQVGVRFVHAQLEGSTASADRRNQAFLTAGLFRRVDYGWQGGLVADYMRDDWFYKTDLLQLRGELSFVCDPCHELGFRFTDSQKTKTFTANLDSGPILATLSSLDTYRFFYRLRFGPAGRGSGEAYAGWSEDSDGMLGLHLNTPLHGQCGLSTAFDYIIPRDGVASPFANEGWNLSMALTWTPGRLFGTGRDYYRPLFEIADNGSMFTRRGP